MIRGISDYLPRPASTSLGNDCSILGSIQDWSRIAYLWLNVSNWRGVQVVPRAWLEEGTRTAELVKGCSAEEDWRYGYAVWANDHDKWTSTTSIT